MKTFFYHRLELRQANALPHDIAIVYALGDFFDAEELCAFLTADFDARLAPDEIKIFTPSYDVRSLTAILDNSPDFKSTKEDRLSGKVNVSVSGFHADHSCGEEHVITKCDYASASPGLKISSTYRNVLTRLFCGSHAMIGGSDAYHFHLPSGKFHSDQFIRVSSVLTNMAEIQYIASALLAFMNSETRIIYVDTPALFSLAMAARDLHQKFWPNEKKINIVNFKSYRGLDAGVEFEGKSLTLISSSAKGALARRLKLDFLPRDQNIVHLFWCGEEDPDTPAICDIRRCDDNPSGIEKEKMPKTFAVDQCDLCDKGSAVISLVGDNFDLPVPQVRRMEVVANDAHPSLQKFVERFVGSGVCGVGLGDLNTPAGKRLFFLDSDRLLNAPRFKGDLDYMLASDLPYDASTIITMNAQSRELAAVINTKLGSKCAVIARQDLTPGVAPKTGAVLIVSSVIESGRSLQDVMRNIRAVFPKRPVSFVVAAWKFSSVDLASSVRNTLQKTTAPAKNRLIVGTELMLPSSTFECSWLDELSLLGDAATREVLSSYDSAYWERRIQRLRDQGKPLKDELFLETSEGNAIELTPGFVFWKDLPSEVKGSQADVFFTVASVLQSKRNATLKAFGVGISEGIFHRTILHPGNFGRFNDSVIQASLLRAASRQELNFSIDPKMSEQAARILVNVLRRSTDGRGAAACEFLMAIATDRMKFIGKDLSAALEACATPGQGVEIPQRVKGLVELLNRKVRATGAR